MNPPRCPTRSECYGIRLATVLAPSSQQASPSFASGVPITHRPHRADRMPPDPRKYLCDAANAAGLARSFAHGQRFAGYQANAMLRAAAEREFEIIGEALNQLSKVAPGLAAAIPGLPRIVAFRNILIQERFRLVAAAARRGRAVAQSTEKDRREPALEVDGDQPDAAPTIRCSRTQRSLRGAPVR